MKITEPVLVGPRAASARTGNVQRERAGGHRHRRLARAGDQRRAASRCSTITGASISDRRTARRREADAAPRRLLALGVARASPTRRTTTRARSASRRRSSSNAQAHDARRGLREVERPHRLGRRPGARRARATRRSTWSGVTQVLSPLALVQSTLQCDARRGLVQRSLQDARSRSPRTRLAGARRPTRGPTSATRSRGSRAIASTFPGARHAAGRLPLLPRRLGHPRAHARGRVAAGRLASAGRCARRCATTRSRPRTSTRRVVPQPLPEVLSSDQRLARLRRPVAVAARDLAARRRHHDRGHGGLLLQRAQPAPRRRRQRGLRDAARVLRDRRASPRPSSPMPLYRFTFRAMAAVNEVQVHADDEARRGAAAARAIDEVLRIEAKYSRYRADSVVSRINAAAGGAPVAIDEETRGAARVRRRLLPQQRRPLRRDLRRAARAPGTSRRRACRRDAELAPLLALIGWDARRAHRHARCACPRPAWSSTSAASARSTRSIAPCAVLARARRASAMVNLAGDLAILGPQPDGVPWRVGIQHPRRADALIATLPVSSGALATSGDYERFIEVDGVRHCHVLDPRTGRSARGFQSVTVHGAELPGRRERHHDRDAEGAQPAASSGCEALGLAHLCVTSQRRGGRPDRSGERRGRVLKFSLFQSLRAHVRRLAHHRRRRSRALERHAVRRPAPGRGHRAHRLRELRQPRGARRAGQRAHQQVRRGLSGQALLRRLRVRRRGRVARHRAREEALRRRVRERAAALGLAGQPGGVLRDAQARRHDPRHVARARRPPHARRVGEPLRQALPLGRLRPQREGRDRLRPGARARRGVQPAHDRRRRLGLRAEDRLAEIPRDRRRGRRAADGGHGALRGPRRRGRLSHRRWASPTSSPAPRTRRCAARAAA